ncbi:MAG: glycosyltransferase family 2 protein [Paracoccaceae bacterium]
MTASVETAEPPVVSILIVSYNTRDMTLDCLRSVAAETRVPHEVILLDNASGDGSAEAVAAAYPAVRLMAERENHGFAKANNIAAQLARGRYLLLLNPDTVILDGAIDKLVAFAARVPEAKIWGGRTLYGDGRLNPTNCWRQISLWTVLCQTLGLKNALPGSRLFNAEGYGGWLRDSEREVELVTGCFLLIERSFWEALGGFDPTFYMYGEEADLCRRAVSEGARPRITPEAEIVHYVGASERAVAGKIVNVLRSKTTLIKRYFPGWRRPVGLVLFRAWPWSRMVAARAKRLVRPDAESPWSEVWTRRAEWYDGYPDARG